MKIYPQPFNHYQSSHSNQTYETYYCRATDYQPADKDIRETEFFKDSKVYGSNTVKVYDRKGNHVKTITLDRWATELAVSPDDKYLYTLTESSEDGYTVLRYAL